MLKVSYFVQWWSGREWFSVQEHQKEHDAVESAKALHKRNTKGRYSVIASIEEPRIWDSINDV